MRRRSLSSLAAKHGTDKLAHGYIPWYEQHFSSRRRERLTILEIGVGGFKDPSAGGESLRMWQDYFPRARIIGIDSHTKELAFSGRVSTVLGSQTDPQFLRRLSAEAGPFDIVIDDGSHVNSQRNTSLEVLFPLLASNGIYVLEDLHTSYLREFYGGDSPGMEPGSSMEVLKRLADGLNYQYIPQRERQSFDAELVSVSFHPKICFLQKGKNRLDVNPVDADAVRRDRLSV